MATVGLPRAMAYYYMYPFYAEFCREIGVQLVVSPPTTKRVLEKMDFCPTDEPCVAVKLLFAHARELLDRGIDRLFIPCLVSLEPKNYCCPKFMGIPYMVKNALESGTQVLSPVIDLSQGKRDWERTWVETGLLLGATPDRARRALQAAWKAQHRFETLCVQKLLSTVEAFHVLESKVLKRGNDQAAAGSADETVAVIGHPYILFDAFSMDLLPKFKQYGRVLTAEMVSPKEIRRQMETVSDGERLWSFEAQLLGAALHYLRNNLVDKLVLVGSFECGPESIIENFVEEEAARYGVPFLLLTLDEHTADAGLATRIEAFMDVQPLPAEVSRTVPEVPVPGLRPERFVIGMPTMGHLDLAIRSALADCGVDSVKTPHANQEVLELGKHLSPEFVCLPFTITLGQMRWLLENGATHLLMVGGKGKCRLGWYAQVQEQLLRRLGYEFELIVIDSPLPLRERWSDFRRTLKRTTNQASWLQILRALYAGYHRMAAIDQAESICHQVRAFESRPGTVDRLFAGFVRRVERAASTESVWMLLNEFRDQAEAIETEDTNPVRVRILGEIWVVLEAHINLHLESLLGKSKDPRVWVDREISVTQWFHKNLFPTREATARKNQIKQAAFPYLETDVGGHGNFSVGLTALAAQEGIDGIIHLMPFTCMPEIVAQNIMVKLSEELDLPVLTFIITDQTGEAGFETRVEAFLDILKDRRTGRLKLEEGA
ncbi:MAG: acyl-CoA dehydratase activase-related protein [Bacillota bacterium]